MLPFGRVEAPAGKNAAGPQNLAEVLRQKPVA